jgi:hypothetical protein
MSVNDLIATIRKEASEETPETQTEEGVEKTAQPEQGGEPGVAGSNLVDGSPAESAAAGEVVQAVMDAKKQVVESAPDSPMVDQNAGTPEDQAVQQADNLQAAAGGDLQARSDARSEEDMNTSQVVGGRMEGAVKAAVEQVLKDMAEKNASDEAEKQAEEEEFSKMAEDAMAYGAMIADGFMARLAEYEQPE